jgi:hypothetical protein
MIMLFPVRWSATRAVGFISYFGTSISCGITWLQARRHPRSYPESAGFALALTIIESLLALDMLFEWRFVLHTVFMKLFMEHDLYNERQPVQLGLLLLLAALLFAAVRMAFCRFHMRMGTLLMLTGVFLSLTLISMEIISMHETDQGLYHLVNGVMVIAYLWVLACALTLLGMRMERRSVVREN